jgi:hypothetical protein
MKGPVGPDGPAAARRRSTQPTSQAFHVVQSCETQFGATFAQSSFEVSRLTQRVTLGAKQLGCLSSNLHDRKRFMCVCSATAHETALHMKQRCSSSARAQELLDTCLECEFKHDPERRCTIQCKFCARLPLTSPTQNFLAPDNGWSPGHCSTA